MFLKSCVLAIILTLVPVPILAAPEGDTTMDINKAKQALKLLEGDYTVQAYIRLGEAIEAAPEPGPTPTPEPTPTPNPSGKKPSELVGKLWTVMAPFNKPGATNSPENLLIARAETDSRYKPLFYMSDKGLVLRSTANGVHSPKSQYARMELRELKSETADSSGQASWDTKKGKHTMTARVAVKHTFVAKPEASLLQIHGGDDDVMQVRIEGKNKLVVKWNDGQSVATLDDNYKQGDFHDFVIEATSGHIKVSYDGVQKVDITGSDSSTAYFKAGAYSQSNVEKGDKPDSYVEVTIQSIKVTHQ